MNACLEVLKKLPKAAAKRALRQKEFFHGFEWTDGKGVG